MTDLNLNLKSNIPEESGKITRGANATGEALVSLDKKVEELDKSFSSFSDGLAKKARPGLEALREATKSTVSELGKQLELLRGSYTELAKSQARSVADIEKLNKRRIESDREVVKSAKTKEEEVLAFYAKANALYATQTADRVSKTAKAAIDEALAVQKGLMMQSDSYASHHNKVQALVKGHFDAMGSYVTAASQKAEASSAAALRKSLMLDSEVVAAQARQVQALVKGHFDAMGSYVTAASQKAEASSAAALRKSLMLDSEVVAAQARQVQAVLKGHYDALGVYQAEAVAKVQRMDSLLRGSSVTTAAASKGVSVGSRDSLMNSVATSSGPSTAQAAIAASQANIELSKSHLQAASAASSNGVAHTNLNSVMRETHSLARGLAGALGQLWVTYGSILPLLAGAAIAGSARQMFEAGKELEYQLTFVTQLTGGAAVSTDQFAASMSGAMIFTKEGALGLRALAQAGLDAEQALAALPSVMTLSTVGEIGMAQAALAATGIMHAFNLEIGDMGHVVDVMTKAGAISNTSVASMAESMKTASVVADQFHVSLEEMSAGLVILGKRNITGTAAGTAFKNIMTELAAPTAKASAKMKQLGIDVYDAEGNLKPFSQQMIEVKKALVGLDEKSKNLALTDMFNERSMKGAAAILKDLDKFIETIDILGNKSQAFADGVVSALGGTVEGQLKMTANAFSLTLDRAFDKTADTWSNLVAKLTAVVSSDGMQGFLVAMSTGITLMIKSVEGFAIMGAALYTYNGVMAISAALEAAQMAALGAKAATQAVVTAETALASAALWEYTAAETAVTAATTAATTATGAAAVATGTLKAVLMSVAWPIAAVMALGTAYYFLRDGANAAAEAEARRGRVAEDVHKQMQERTLQLSQENAARTMAIAQSISYESALLKVKHAATEETKTTLAQAAAQDTLRVARIKAGMAAIAPEDRHGLFGFNEWDKLQRELNEAEASLRQSSQHLDNAKRDQERALRDVGAQNDRYSQEGVSKAYYKVGSDIETLYKDLEERRKNGQKGLEGVMATVKGLETAAQKLGNSVKVGDSVTDATAVNELTKGYKEAKKAADSLATSVGSPAKNAASAAVKLSDAQKLVNAGEKAYGDIMARETGYAANFTETVLSLVAARDKNNWSSEKYNEVIAAYVALQPFYKEMVSEEKKEAEAAAKRWGEGYVRQIAEEEKAYRKLADAIEDVDKTINSLLRENDKLQVGNDLNLSLMGQTAEVRAAAIEQQQVLNKYLDAENEARLKYLDPTVLQSKLELIEVQKLRALELSAQSKAITAWNKTFDTVESGLVSALMTGGKEGGKAARDLIAKMLILEPFEIVVKAYLQPVTTALTNLALDATGLASSASTSSGIMGMANTGSSLLSPTGMLGTLGSGVSSGFGMAWGAGGGGISEALSMGTALFEGGSIMEGIGAFAGALGPIALGLGAVVGILGSIGNDRAPSQGTGEGQISYSATGAVTDTYSRFGEGDSNLGITTAVTDAITAMYTDYAKVVTSLGIQAIDTQFSYGTNTGLEGKDPQFAIGSNANGVGFSSGEIQQSAEAIQLAASRAVFSALQASEMPKYLAGAFDGIVASTATQEEITAALEGATALKGFHDQLQLLPWENLKDMTYATTQALVDMSGGLDALQTNLGTFYDNFYTDAEKTALLTANTTEAFAALGITMPAVDGGMRDWYRVLVESVLALDQSDAANAGATVAVLALQGAVDELAPAFTDATKAIAEYQSWQDKLDVLTGVTTERAQRQAADLAAAADDQTRALINQVYAAEDAADAAQVVADSMQSLTDALKTMADETAGVIASMGDIGKTDFQKSISQIIRDGATNQATLNTYAAGASTVTSATTYSAPASQSPSRFTAEQDASIKSFIAGLDWSAAGTAASSTMLLSAMTEAGVSLEDLSNLGYATADLKNVASFATAEINNALVAANPIMAYTSSNYSNWGGPAESGGSFVGSVGTGSTGSGTSASAADNTNAKLNAAYAEQLQIIMDTYQPDMQQIDAMTALKTAGFVIDDLDATGIKKYFFDLASAADPLTTQGKATIDALDSLTNQIALLGQVATERQAWQDKLDVLSLKTTQRALDLQRDLASTTDAATQSLIKQVYAFEDASAAIATRFNDSKSATDTAFSVLQKSVDAQRDIVSETISNVTDIIDSIDSAVKQLRGEADPLGQFDAAQSWLDNALTNAKLTGYLPDTQELSDAISTLGTGLDAQVYASEADASFNKLVIAGKLQALGDIAKPQLTTAQQQLADLDKILDTAQAQLDALNGINNSVLSVADALANFNSATKSQAGATVPSGGTLAMTAPAGTQYNGDEIKSIQDLYTVNLGRVGDAGGMAYWAGQFMSDGVIDAAEKQAFALASIPEYKAAHGLATGTNYVPYDGFQATLHEGEAVVPKVYNPAAGAQTNARLEALVETLTIEVQRLQSIVNDGNKSNDRIASTLENVTEGGANMRTVAA